MLGKNWSCQNNLWFLTVIEKFIKFWILGENTFWTGLSGCFSGGDFLWPESGFSRGAKRDLYFMHFQGNLDKSRKPKSNIEIQTRNRNSKHLFYFSEPPAKKSPLPDNPVCKSLLTTPFDIKFFSKSKYVQNPWNFHTILYLYLTRNRKFPYFFIVRIYLTPLFNLEINMTG